MMSYLAKEESKGKQREAPPSLFLGPPSHNASHVSLTPALQHGTNLVPTATVNSTSSNGAQRVPLIRQRSQRMPQRSNLDGLVETRTALPRQQQPSEGQKQADRTDALWAEMQSTLEEVEISAVSGTHVFGPEHARSLEELRTAQISLAQAWARSEAEDAIETADKESRALKGVGIVGSDDKGALDGTEGGRDTVNSGSARPGSSAGLQKTALKFEEETEADILLARKRREANDKFFQRVNTGVLDVVAKLEEVAVAMRAVEQESRDMWGDTESATTGVS